LKAADLQTKHLSLKNLKRQERLFSVSNSFNVKGDM